MKIEQLLHRESFGPILEATLSRHFAEIEGKPVSVIWRSRRWWERLLGSMGSGAGVWLCNPYLNVIFPARGTADRLSTVRRAFENTPHRWKRLPQKLYVWLATHSRTAGLFADHALQIRPEPREGREMLVVGGNNKVRLFWPRQGRIIEILKYGSDPALLAAELTVLENASGTIRVPRLCQVARDRNWFQTEYIDAVSLNRLRSDSGTGELVEQALTQLRDWLSRSEERIRSLDRAAQLAESLARSRRSAAVLAPEEHKKLQSWVGEIVENLTKLEQRRATLITTAVGHGDFQCGNILVDGQRNVWIVDWENSARRQWMYDFLVYALRARFPDGLAKRFESLLAGPDRAGGQLPLPPGGIVDTQMWIVTLGLYLLEELDWAVKENSNPTLLRASGTWIGLRGEMDAMVAALTHVCRELSNQARPRGV